MTEDFFNLNFTQTVNQVTSPKQNICQSHFDQTVNPVTSPKQNNRQSHFDQT